MIHSKTYFRRSSFWLSISPRLKSVLVKRISVLKYASLIEIELRYRCRRGLGTIGRFFDLKFCSVSATKRKQSVTFRRTQNINSSDGWTHTHARLIKKKNRSRLNGFIRYDCRLTSRTDFSKSRRHAFGGLLYGSRNIITKYK